MKANFDNNSAWWSLPDYEEIHLFNEAAEQATIKAIVDGTCSARSWSDIQHSWPWCKPSVYRVKPVPAPRIQKKKQRKQWRAPSMTRQGRKVYRILLANGISREDAKRMAIELVGVK